MPQEDEDLALALELQGQEVGFAVEPITDCPHLPASTEGHPVFLDKSCEQCRDNVENWQCLSCDVVLCSRYRQAHMTDHSKATGHPVCLSYSDLSFWCGECNSYVTHKTLDNIKYAAYVAKFKQEPPTLVTTRIINEQDQPSSSSSS